MTLRVSVVVPTYRRPTLLARCLRALVAQRFDPAEYEILVADDAASAETEAVVEAIARRVAQRGLALRYLAVRGAHGPAAARNLGWQVARGALIAFTDDDCIPDAGWLRAGVAAMREGVAGASGRLIVPCYERPTDYQRNAALLAGAEFATANCFYRRDILRAVGGFDERFPVAWREDSDLAFTLIERGAQLVMAPDARVVHPIRAEPWLVSIGQQQRSMYNALLYCKHPRLYREQIQATPPWRYYAIVGAALLGVAGACGRRRGRLILGVSVWCALTAQFYRLRTQGASTAPTHLVEMALTSAIIPPVCVYWRLRGALRYRTLFL